MENTLPIAPSVSINTRVVPEAAENIRAASVPWYIWCTVAAITSTTVGLYWDVSWHISIGRDTFWTPAHMAVYFCGVLAGISCGYLILSTTFGMDTEAQAASVKIWGFRGPLGAFIAAWGGIAMITSAPFDNWWHAAYGLDVTIMSPPHVLLIAGMVVVGLGALIMILGSMNRATGAPRKRLERLFLYVGALLMVLVLILTFEYIERWNMHSPMFYRVVAMAVPVMLVGVARGSGRRWGSTTVIALTSALQLAGLWILPLFHAEPKLGPVYQNIQHFIPLDFPLLLIVPAVILDVLWVKMNGWSNWLQATVGGSAFLLTFLAVQWPFADFLLSPASRNWIFGTNYLGYNWEFTPPETAYQFFGVQLSPSEFWIGMGIALIAAMISTGLGLAWADWMKKIRR